MSSRYTIQDVCEAVFAGLSAAKSDSAPQPSVKAIGLRALHVTGVVHYDDLEDFVPAASPKQASVLREGDVLVAIRGSLPKAALVQNLPPFDVYATGNLGVLRPGPDVDPYFLWAALTAMCVEPGAPKFRRISTGQMSMRTQDLAKLEVVMPPLREQRELGRAAKSLRLLISSHEQVLAQSHRVFAAFLRERVLLQ